MQRFRIVMLVAICVAATALRAQTIPTTQSDPPDRSTPAAGIKAAVGAIQRDDADGLMDCLLLPVELRGNDQRAYGQRLVLGSQLEWLLEDKFGIQPARALLSGAGSIQVRDVDLPKLQWQVGHPTAAAMARGVTDEAVSRSRDAGAPIAVMAKTPAGWKLDRAGISTGLLAVAVADAPWRNATLRRVLMQVRTGKLGTEQQVRDALALHAPPASTNPIKPDRSTPRGTVAAIQDAIERGDIPTLQDSFVMMGGDKDGSIPRMAEDQVVCRKLEKAWPNRFGAERAKRLAQYLPMSIMRLYDSLGWVIDGDVARGVRNGRYLMRRMVRSGGVWRIELPPSETPLPGAEKAFQRREALREHRRNVLDHPDQYPTVGSVLDVLDPVRSDPHEPTTRQYAERTNLEIHDLKKRLATQPAPTTQEDFVQSFNILLAQLSVALVGNDPTAAASFYRADGDDGSYVLAREKRVIATRQLLTAADKEIDSGAEALGREFHLIDCADDLMSMAMIQWTVNGDRAIGTKPEGLGGSPFWMPTLRRVDNKWKIDVTDEAGPHPKQQAVIARNETEQLEKITPRIQRDEFKTLNQLRETLRSAGIKGNGKDY